MKKRSFLFIFVYLLFLFPFITVSVFLSIEKDKNALKDKGFISLEKRIEDYEYFWDFIYNGYPFTEVCERLKGGLKKIKDQEYKNVIALEKRTDYYTFYSRLCSRITDGKDIGHLYPSDYYDFRDNFYTIPIYKNFIKDMSLIDSFYRKLMKVSKVDSQKKIISSINNRIPYAYK